MPQALNCYWAVVASAANRSFTGSPEQYYGAGCMPPRHFFTELGRLGAQRADSTRSNAFSQ